MQGLKLAEQYFQEYGRPLLERFPHYKGRIAAGLVGDGSECFGFDDEVSRDHDWGPAFCLWLTSADYQEIAAELQAAYDDLPKQFAGFNRKDSALGGGRTGVFASGAFYKRFIGFDYLPDTLQKWRVIPETHLAVATNGKVFTDPLGEFSAVRAGLLAFYPEDVRLKKIAARCMTMAQAGQYNYPRCLAHNEYVAARYAEAQFIDAAISMVFLLNRRYKPFYKWMHRALKSLPVLGHEIWQLCQDLVTMHEREQGESHYGRKAAVIEEISQHVISELVRQGLSDSISDFLLDHGPVVHSLIRDTQLRAGSVWVE